MGIIRRQSILNLLFSYLGVGLGYVNKILLFTVFLTKEQWGLVEVLLAVAVICSSFAQFGAVQIIIRFLPYFSNSLKRLRSFNFLTLSYPVAGSLVVSFLLWLFQEQIGSLYLEKSPFFIEKYFYVFPLFIGLTFTGVFTGLCRANMKSVVPTLLNEVFIRLWQMLIVVFHYLGWYDFDTFLLLFVLSYFLEVFVLIIYLAWLGKLQVQLDFKVLKSRIMRIATNFGFFSFLFLITDSLVTRLDVAMLGMLSGLEDSAIYVFGLYIATVVVLPSRSIYSIAFPVVAKSFRERDMENIENLYKKTSLHNLIAGYLIFIGIWVNLDVIFLIRPEFEPARYVVLFIGLAKLIELASGINGGIIMVSKFYRFNLYINLFLLVLVVSTNYLLIPVLGVTGAAMATAMSILLFNLGKGIFIYHKFQMQPFTRKTLILSFIAGVALLTGMYIPSLHPWWLDMGIRSLAVVVVFGIPVYLLKISPDANQFVGMMIKKAGIFR